MRLGLMAAALLAYLAGIILAALAGLSPPAVVAVIPMILSALIVAKNKKIAAGLMLFAFFLSGLYLTSLKLGCESPFVRLTGEAVSIQGRVVNSAQYPNRNTYLLQEAHVEHQGKTLAAPKKERVQLSVYNQEGVYSHGTVLKIKGQPKLPAQKRNPGGFDYRKYLQRKGVFVSIGVDEGQVDVIAKDVGNPILWAADKVKLRILSLLGTLPQVERAIAQAVVLGDKGSFTPEDRNVFQGLGVMHIFAVSGLHVGFVLLFLAALVGNLKLPRITGNIIIISALFFYAAITGFATPVLRASIMLGIYWWGRTHWNNLKTANTLLAAALLLLLLNPLSAFDAGFQLTFAATAFIVFLTPVLKTAKCLRHDILLVSLAAWLGTLPLIAYYFNVLTPLGIVLALPAGAMAGAVIILSFIATMLQPIWDFAAQILVLGIGGITFFCNKLAQLFGKLPLLGEGLIIATPSLLSLFLYYFAAILVFLSYNYRYNPRLRLFLSKTYKPLVTLFAATIIMFAAYHFFSPSHLEVTFLDVGQGDCIVIKTPDNKTAVIDGGDFLGQSSYGDLVLIPFLRHQGIKKVDLVINTHPHNDHLAGLYPILNKYPIGLVLTPEGFDGEYQQLQSIAKQRSLTSYYGCAGQSLELGKNTQIELLHPPKSYPGHFGANNHSIVTALSYGGISFLLTGDIEQDAIKQLLAFVECAHVLKLPHHGSSGSFNKEFLAKVNPKVAVIQVGENNSFGHPGQNVLDYLEAESIPVYRNDLHGAISIYTRGQTIDRIDTIIKPSSEAMGT